MTLPGTLLDGAGIGLATATWRLMGERQKRRHQAKADAQDAEVQAQDDLQEQVKGLRRVTDNIMVFLVGKKEQGGLPGPEGFLAQHERFQRSVLERFDTMDAQRRDDRAVLDQLASSVRTLEAEWKPNGGHSSYDRLRRVDERGEDPDAR